MKFDLKTVNDVFFRACGAGDERVMQFRDDAGKWQPITGNQLYARVRALAAALAEWGIGAGDRVALLSENRWEWPVTDFAVLTLGAVDVPLYPTLTAQQVATMLADSGARAIVVSTAAQYEKVAAIRDRTKIEKVVVMDKVSETVQATWLGNLMLRDETSARDTDFDRHAYDVRSDDLATIIYTSGTTGESKGVMLTHGNLAANLNVSTIPFHWRRQDVHISFLPLSHITARHIDYALFCHGAVISYCPQFDFLPRAMHEVRPTVFVGVPRVYEKVRQEVARRAGESRVRSSMLAWALRCGQKQRDVLLSGRTPDKTTWKIADRLVYRKIRAGFGGRVGTFISGGAPLGVDTSGWFLDAGICIREGYGLTETSPVVSLNSSLCRFGSVGQLVPNIEARIASDGELLVRGPSVFKGYWNRPGETAEVLDREGWFATGDIGNIDTDGFLYITDRKKDLLKTSGGKLIAPQPIENRLKAYPLVGNAIVVGDGHKFASVLISPEFPALETWAHERGISFANRTELVSNPAIIAEYQRLVDQINATLASFETLKRMCVVADTWTLDTGDMTPTMKLKRRSVERRHAAEIAAIYADEATAHG